MKIALAPVNVKIGDFEGNLEVHRKITEKAAKAGADLVVFPELSLIGYMPMDLLHRPDFLAQAEEQLGDFQEWLAEKFPKLAVVVGTALPSPEPTGKGAINCAVFLTKGKMEVRAKTLIPYYNVFYESRYFDSAAQLADPSLRGLVEWKGAKIGILICEDSWHKMQLHGRTLYTENPTAALAKKGADFLVNLSASPYDTKKIPVRRNEIGSAAKEYGLPIAYVNHFGAHDEILFDGDAFVCGAKGEVLAEKVEANPDLLYWDTDAAPAKTGKTAAKAADSLERLHTMLVTGIRDYAAKNGFKRAVLGLSGGIDSALVAALTAEALGPQNVTGLVLPSKYSSVHSIEDAEALARNLGLSLKHLPIKMAHSTMSLALQPLFAGTEEGTAEENLQSRIRGVYVMAYSNKFSAMALATGNKSEFAMGYATLYGDTCGALAPIGDLYKTEVYALSRFVNSRGTGAVIPENTLTKAPSAELKPNQTDQDTLPPYEVLDYLLYLMIEKELAVDLALEKAREKFPKLKKEVVDRVQRTLATTQYKRRQAPPILRVSKRAFGQGRLYPVTATF